MRFSWLWLTLAALPLAGAENLLYNAAFQLGEAGFAQRRVVRLDTNPERRYLPLRFVPGGVAVDNPYRESFELCLKSVYLEAGKTYRFSVRMKSGVSDYPIRLGFYGVTPGEPRKPVGQRAAKRCRVGEEFQEFTVEFTPKISTFFLPSVQSLEEPPAAVLTVADFRLAEVAPTTPDDRLELAVAADARLYEKGEKAKLELRAWNNSPRPLRETVTLTATDDLTGMVVAERRFPVELAPGAKVEIPAELPLDRFGGLRLQLSAPGRSLSHPAQLAVIGRYEAKPVDLRKGFVLGINGGFQIVGPPRLFYHDYGYLALNAPVEEPLALLARCGIRVLRLHDGANYTSQWRQVEPQDGKFDFSLFNETMAMLEKYHMIPLPVLGSFVDMERAYPGSIPRMPEWLIATSPRQSGETRNVMGKLHGKVILPSEELWRRFVREFVRNAGDRIPFYEIMNEPNLSMTAENYCRYLKSASEEIRREAPKAGVVGLCVTSDLGAKIIADFTVDCLKQGALDWVDAVSFHPYSARTIASSRPADREIEALRELIRSYGDRPLWNTELYFLFDVPPEQQGKVKEGVFLPDQLIRRTLTDLGEGIRQSQAVTDSGIWPRLLDEGLFTYVPCEWLPSANLSAFNALARLFEGAEPAGKFRYRDAAVCYLFRKDGAPVAALWNYAGKSGLRADLSPFRVLDLFGNSLEGQQFEVTESPLYLYPKNENEADFTARLKKLAIK